MRIALVYPGNTGQALKLCPGHYREYLAHLGPDADPGKVIYTEGSCAGCKANGAHPLAGSSLPGKGAKMTIGASRKVAHDSGDGATVFHCPFCGSGQVIARSDRTIECEYCHTCFTVQVQPQFPAFPQTINGQPMQVPGMPGQIGGPPAAPGQDPMDPMAGGVSGEDDGNPFADDTEDGGEPGEGPGDDSGEDDEDGAPPFAKGSMLRTASGAQLSYNTYLKHLAIKFADDRDAVIERVRQEG
jgi:predicted RNA-binding Zn-ribbon protein involved in translation (DUF1610 family)